MQALLAVKQIAKGSTLLPIESDKEMIEAGAAAAPLHEQYQIVTVVKSHWPDACHQKGNKYVPKVYKEHLVPQLTHCVMHLIFIQLRQCQK